MSARRWQQTTESQKTSPVVPDCVPASASLRDFKIPCFRYADFHVKNADNLTFVFVKTNLAALIPGEKAIIDSFTDPELSVKLLEMGCTPGEEVEMEKIAPLGDPIAVRVAGYLLSLRLAEAATVKVLRVRNAS
jgi:ferrous iron transport protein A